MNIDDLEEVNLDLDLDSEELECKIAPVISKETPQHKEFVAHFQSANDRVQLLERELAHALDERSQICELGKKYGINFSESS